MYIRIDDVSLLTQAVAYSVVPRLILLTEQTVREDTGRERVADVTARVQVRVDQGA